MSQFIGISNIIATTGVAPGAITPHANTRDGDVLLFFHYSAVTGGNETVTEPTGFTAVGPAGGWVSAVGGLLQVAWKLRATGETTYTAQGITNHASGVSGESVLEFILTWADVNVAALVASVVSALSTWASSLTMGPVAATGLGTVPPRGTLLVFAGRKENTTAQTLLTGDNLTWATAALADTTSGADASCVVQYGVNNTTSAQTVTAKSVTTTGTAQAGGGIMLVLSAPPAGTIGGIWPESNSYIGPIRDGNGNLYTVSELTDTPPNPCMRKSADGGVTWLEQNATNRPTAQDLESAWCVQQGTVIHLLFQRSGSMIVYYHTFNTSDAASNPDTWQTRDQIVHTPTTAPANQAVSLVVKASGDAYAFYRGDPSGTDQRIYYRKKPSGGAWGAAVSIDSTAGKSFTQVQGQLGSDGATIHIFYKNDTDSKILWQTLSGSDVLSGSTALNPTTTTTDDETAVSPPALVVVSGVERVMTAWKRLSDSMLIGVAIDGGAVGAEETVSHAAVYEDPPLATSLQTVGTLVADDTTDVIWVLYADDATHDLWYRARSGTTWSTAVELLDGVDVQYVSGNIYTHSVGNGGAKVLGVVYDDVQGLGRGVPRYTEFTPTVPTAPTQEPFRRPRGPNYRR